MDRIALRRVSLPIAALSTLLGAVAAIAGPIDPPAGPVAPTYKTLTEVEPRIAINLTSTPGDADSVFKISQSGSYYLTGELTGVASKHGIEVSTANVTIDLCGFTLRGVPGSLVGIRTDGSHNNVTIRNGSVTAWGSDGIRGEGSGSLVEQITASSNGGNGIVCTISGVVRGCTASANVLAGIFAQSGALVENCSARQNQTGISLGLGALARGCSARQNSVDGFSALNGNSSIIDCSAVGNLQKGMTAAGGCTINRCNVSSNRTDGIAVTFSCLVFGNTCTFNGDVLDGANIHATGANNRIESNHCTGADRGIDVDVGGNFIVRNTCSANTTNWDVVAGNVCLVEQAGIAGAVLGNTGGVAPGSTDPNANFTY